MATDLRQDLGEQPAVPGEGAGGAEEGDQEEPQRHDRPVPGHREEGHDLL